MNSIDTAFFLVFIFSIMGIGLWQAGKVQQESSYLLADRKTGLFALTATLVMTEFNTSTLVAFSSMGYLTGLFAITLPAVFLIGLLFYSGVVAKKWKQFNGLSVAQFFTQRYGRKVGRMASLALLTAMAGFSAVYVKSLTLLFSLIFPFIPFGILSLLLVAIVVFVTLRGGLVSIIHTDVLSFCVIAFFLPSMAYFAWSAAEFPSMNQFVEAYPIESATAILPPSFVIAITLITMFTYILAPWYGQKIFAAQNEKVARKSVFLAAILVFGFYSCAVFAVSLLKLKGIVLSSPDLALPHLLQNLMPRGWKGLGYAVFFAAAATTLSGVWSAMTSMVIADFLERKDQGSYKRGAWITLVFATLSYLLANTLVDQVFQKLILANIPVLALSFALLSGFYWEKASSKGAILSIVVGLLWGIGVYFYYGEAGGYQWYWAIYGIPLIFLTGFGGSFLFPDRLPRVVQQG